MRHWLFSRSTYAFDRLIGLVDRIFAIGPGDLGSISMSSHTEDFKKWYLIPLCLTLSNIRLVSKVKRSNQGKEVAPSPTPRWSSYCKGSLLVTLDYGCQILLYVAFRFFFFM